MSNETTRPDPKPSALERIIGDRPMAVVVRLLVVSLVVGFVMSMLGLNAQSLLEMTVRLFRDVLHDSAGVFRSLAFYVLTGAAIVVPIWLVLRLTSASRRK